MIIGLGSCRDIRFKDYRALRNLMITIDGKGNLRYTTSSAGSIMGIHKFIDVSVYKSGWLKNGIVNKDILAPYCAYHFYKKMSKKSLEEYEAIRVVFDGSGISMLSRDYIYTLSQLNQINRSYTVTKNYVEELFAKKNQFNPYSFINNKSIKVDSIDEKIKNKIGNELLNIQLLSFKYLDNGYFVIYTMIEKRENKFVGIQFLFSDSEENKIVDIDI